MKNPLKPRGNRVVGHNVFVAARSGQLSKGNEKGKLNAKLISELQHMTINRSQGLWKMNNYKQTQAIVYR